MKAIVIKENGVSARIRHVSKVKDGRKYLSFVVDYNLLGQRKQVWRSTLEDAKDAAYDACRKIATGEQHSLELTNGDRMAYLRATEAISGVRGASIDVACREYADAVGILEGRASVVEACREWIAQCD